MKNILTLSLFLIFTFVSVAQETIDSGFAFDTDPNKLYSLYIPSSYNASEENSLMLALHPFNTNRWDAKAWRDTLIVFAEANDLILVCPDGGVDGKVDSPIDTAFTTTLLDSMAMWYNIDAQQQYVMGFSWGAKTSYTYGLRRTDKFSGYLIIGAAVEINEVTGIVENAKDESFFLVHGANDSPNTRFTPLLNALSTNEACVESRLMSGVGHTIDLPNRNAILTEAFQWIVSNNCQFSSTEETINSFNFEIFPNPASDYIEIKLDNISDFQINLFDLTGQKVLERQNENVIQLGNMPKGIYKLECVDLKTDRKANKLITVK